MTEVIRLLDTRAAAEYLTSCGYRISTATLNKLRCVGGGPEYQRFGRQPIYADKKLIEWALSKISDPKPSTSDTAEAA